MLTSFPPRCNPKTIVLSRCSRNLRMIDWFPAISGRVVYPPFMNQSHIPWSCLADHVGDVCMVVWGDYVTGGPLFLLPGTANWGVSFCLSLCPHVWDTGMAARPRSSQHPPSNDTVAPLLTFPQDLVFFCDNEVGPNLLKSGFVSA